MRQKLKRFFSALLVISMLMNLLSKALPEGGRYASLGEAAIYALIGFAVVFLGISFLILVVWLVGKVMDKATKKTTDKKVATKQAETKQEVAPVSDELTDETIAVIMAALTAYYQQNNSKCEFTVKRIKRL